MPDVADIKRFTPIFDEIASERDVLAQQGEELEEIPFSEEGLTDDLRELLETPGDSVAEPADVGAAETGPDLEGAAEPGEPESGLDFETLFGDEQEGQAGLDELPSDFQADAAPVEDTVDVSEEGVAADLELPDFDAEDSFQPPDELLGDEGLAALDSELEQGPTEDEGLPGLTDEAAIDDAGDAPVAEIVEGEAEGEPRAEISDAAGLEDEDLGDAEDLGDFDEGDSGDFEIPDLDTEDVLTADEAESPEADLATADEMADTSETTSGADIEGEEIESFQPPGELLDEDELENLEDDLDGLGEQAGDEVSIPSLDTEDVDFDEQDEFAAAAPEVFGEQAPGAEEPDDLGEISDLDDLESVFEDGEELQGVGEAAPEIEGLEDDTELGGSLEDEGGEEELDLTAEELEKDEDLEDMEAFEMDAMEDDEDFQIDEFALPETEDEITEDEGLPEEPALGEEEAAPEAMPVSEEEELVFKERRYTDEEFERIQATLATLPLNLKILTEEIIGENQISTSDQQKLLDLLIRGRSSTEIATFVSKATGKRIQIPKRFEKKTGLTFAQERRTFAYNFRENIFPILRVFIPAAVIVVLLGFAINAFIITPITANYHYSRGLTLIGEDKYEEAESAFEVGNQIQTIKNWYYQYADEYIDRRQYTRAREKYKAILDQPAYRDDEKARLDWAALESEYFGNHAKAEELIEHQLKRNIFDYDTLLAYGDNYMRWAEVDPSQYDNAHDAYMRILRGRDGDRDEAWFRMLRYYIETDRPGEKNNLEKVETIKRRFQADTDAKIEPKIYAQLAGYLITRDRLEDVKDILTRTMKVEQDLPDTYYQFARYFRELKDPLKEEEALDYARHYLEQRDIRLEQKEARTKEDLALRINTWNRLAELYAGREEYIKAETTLDEATNWIEQSLDRRIFQPNADFGRVYYNRGNIHYYVHRDMDTARRMFTRARENTFADTELDYKMGYIDYSQGSFQDALIEFHTIEPQYASNRNLLYAMANTLYQRSDFFAAQGYYNRLLDILQEQRNQIPLLRPDEEPDHYSLVDMIMKTYNNLGAALKKQSESQRNQAKETDALVQFTRSSEYFDLLNRNPETLQRGETKNLAYLNSRGILYPSFDFESQIYSRIPRDTAAMLF